MKYVSQSEKDTFNIGRELAKSLSAGDTVAFFGELGAGKTAFTKGICSHFGICDVHSPTFTIVNEYYGDITVYHFDAYRIDADGWINGGFDEYLDKGGICVIEWAENLDGVLPYDTVRVYIKRDISKGDNCRNIEIIRKQGK